MKVASMKWLMVTSLFLVSVLSTSSDAKELEGRITEVSLEDKTVAVEFPVGSEITVGQELLLAPKRGAKTTVLQTLTCRLRVTDTYRTNAALAKIKNKELVVAEISRCRQTSQITVGRSVVGDTGDLISLMRQNKTNRSSNMNTRGVSDLDTDSSRESGLPEVDESDDNRDGPSRRQSGVVGIILGIAVPLSEGDSVFGYGLTLGANAFSDDSGDLFVLFGVSRSSKNYGSFSGVTLNGSSTGLGIDILTRFKSGFFLGGGFGLGLVSVDATSGTVTQSASGSAFTIGPTLGWDVPLSREFSIAILTSLGFSTSFRMSGTLGTFEVPSSKALSFTASFRYNF